MSGCVNLSRRFGRRYRIRHDPAFDPSRRHRNEVDPWTLTIPCKYGEIYPHGGEYLAVDIDYHPVMSRQVEELPECELTQDGDQEKTFRFHVKHLRNVADIVKPYRKPKLSDERRAEMRRLMTEINSKKTST